LPPELLYFSHYWQIAVGLDLLVFESPLKRPLAPKTKQYGLYRYLARRSRCFSEKARPRGFKGDLAAPA
jgi:hypothetical protein